MTTESANTLLAARPLRQAYGELIWTQPGMFRRELRLEAGSELLATLRWEKALSFEARADSADGGWIIGRQRKGSPRGRCVVRDAATGAEVAGFQRTWRGTGVARFASGAEFQWKYEGFWRPTYFWTTDGEHRLITFTNLMAIRDRIEMGIDPAARQLAELPVLTLLGTYVMRMLSAERRGH